MKNKYYLLLLLPMIMAITAMHLNKARGPYWLGTNLDPEYVYLLNADNLAGFKGVGHIDHPGTPVQVLGAVTLRAVHFFSSTGNDLHTDVLKHPEYYLTAINIVMVVLNVLMLLLMGVIVYRMTRSIWAGLWIQIAPFFSIVILQSGLTRVTPEPLLFFAGMAIVCVMVYVLSNLSDLDRLSKSYTKYNVQIILFALITGFGIACKVTFAPVMLIPLIVLPGLRNKIYYLAASAAGFIIFTLPIIRMYNRFFQWIYLLLSHSGHYGSGPAGLITAGRFFDNIKQLVAHNFFFSFTLFLDIAIVAAVLLIPKLRKISLPSIHFKMLTAVTITQTAGLIMVSKHSADHYLLPVLNLSGVALLFLFFHMKYLAGFYNMKPKYTVIGAGVISIILFIMINPPLQIIKASDRLTCTQEKLSALHREVTEGYRDYAVIYYYTASSPEYALKFGNDLSRSYHSEALENIYKNVYFYDIWTQRFTGFDFNRGISFEAIESRYGDKIVFQGTRGTKIPGISLRKVFDNKSAEYIRAR